jgi:hypothetical protein
MSKLSYMHGTFLAAKEALSATHSAQLFHEGLSIKLGKKEHKGPSRKTVMGNVTLV